MAERAWRPEYDRSRSPSERVHLRLAPEDAARLRAAAAAAGRDVGAFALDLLDERPQIAISLHDAQALDAASIALGALPGALLKLRAEVAMLSGRLTSYFIDAPEGAAAHRIEINAALRDVQDAMARLQSQALAARAESAEGRAEVVRCLRGVRDQLGR